jgi:hypothetical protein
MLRDLMTPGKARALWTAPVSELWQQLVVPEASPVAEPVKRSLAQEAVALLRTDPPSADAFNAWRAEIGYRPLFLAKVELKDRDLRGFDLRNCILAGADLRGADLRGCLLHNAVLKNARIAGATLSEDTLDGHDMAELADALENQDFRTWIRSLPAHTRATLISVTESDRKFKQRKQLMICGIKFRNNVRNPLKLKAWLENGVHSELVAEFRLDAYGAHEMSFSIARKKYTPDRPVKLAIYLEGLTEPFMAYQFWAWERH